MANPLRLLVALLLLTAIAGADEQQLTKSIDRLRAPNTRLRDRLTAVDQIAKLGKGRDLIEAWMKGDKLVHDFAPTCFHAMGVRALGDALTAMSSKDPKRRVVGAIALGSIGRGAKLGVGKLDKALNDKSSEVRRAATLALGNVGMPAEDAIPGLVLLSMRDKSLTLEALRAITRITLDVELLRLRPVPERRLGQIIESAQTWLRFKENSGGGWGGGMTDALVLLAMVEGGISDVNRAPARRALRKMVARYAEAPAPPPLIPAILLMAWRETRDPLYLTVGNNLVNKLMVSKTDGAITSNLLALAARQAQWCGNAVTEAVWQSIPPTEPVLLGRVLRPGPADTKTEAAEAGRLAAQPLQWNAGDPRWEPRRIVRESGALYLAGGDSRKRYRDSLYEAVFPAVLPAAKGEPLTAGHWEPPTGVNATGVTLTAAITVALRLNAGQFPPRRLSFPTGGKQKMAITALRGALHHPDAEVVAYAKAMLALWR